MCVASPGKIIKIENKTATIEYNSNKSTANIGIVDVKVGDWVLVHAGLVIQVVDSDEAEKMLELYKELEEL